MKQRVEEEAKKEEELSDKYMCYCTSSKASLQANIRKDEVKAPMLQGSLLASQSALKNLEEDLKSAKQELAAVEGRLAEAHALRNQDRASFQKTATEFQVNIHALSQAIAALEGGGTAKAASSLLQGDADATAKLKRLLDARHDAPGQPGSTSAAMLTSERRDAIAQLLDIGVGTFRSSGEVLGICQQLKATMEDSLKRAESKDSEAQANFEMLTASGKKEVDALTTDFEKKQVRFGALQVKVVNLKEDLDTATKALAANTALIKDLEVNCAVVASKYSEHKKMRTEELITITETITMLDSHESREAFRGKGKSSGGNGVAASFLQMSISAVDRRAQAVRILRVATAAAKEERRSAQLDLLVLALRGRRLGFDQVVRRIKDMIALLRREQTNDDQRKAFCETEAKENGLAMKAIATDISDLSKAIGEGKEDGKAYEQEIEDTKEAIEKLDAALTEASTRREENHKEFVQLLASNQAMIHVIGVARNRLQQFYNPKVAQYKPPSQDESHQVAPPVLNPNEYGPGAMAAMSGMALGQEDSIASQLALLPGAPEPPKQIYEKHTGHAGVLEMLQELSSEIIRDTEEAKLEEKNHQKSYEITVKDSAKKRAMLVDTLIEKESVQANVANEIHKQKQQSLEKERELKELQKYKITLDKECMFLLGNYDVRKRSRSSEEDALRGAMDVLSVAN